MTKKAIYLALISFVLIGFQCSSDYVISAKKYIEANNFEKAEPFLLNEIETNPYADEGYYLLGYIKAEQKKFSEMNEFFNKSLSISDRFKKKIEELRKNSLLTK